MTVSQCNRQSEYRSAKVLLVYSHLKCALVVVLCRNTCNCYIFDSWLVAVVDTWLI